MEPPPAPRGRLRKRLLALLVGYALVELVLMPVVAAKAPLRLRSRLPTPMYILGEPSKDGLLPDDYVLVLGDSYAEGYGDWLTEALGQPGNAPFQATDLLHERLGRDVVTFGRGGASSLSATVFLVEKRFAALRRTGFGEPADVVVYFYEGNDLVDNLNEAVRYADVAREEVTSLDDAALDALVAKRASSGFWKGLPGNLYAPYALLNALKGEASGLEVAPIVIPFVDVTDADGRPAYNVVAVGERRLAFDGRAESPSLGLTGEEVAFALRVLERSLVWARERFADASLTLVYLPAPLSCYELTTEEVDVRATLPGRERRFPAAAVRARSDDVRARVAALAARLGLPLVDTTDALRAAAHVEPVHGPTDAFHFNRRGYTVLADALADALR